MSTALKNGVVANPEETAASETWLNDALAVNLDEVVIEEYDVAFVEFEEKEMPDGTKMRRPRKRIAHISNYVPMDIFNRMMSSYQVIAKVDDAARRFDWMVTQVLEVWKLSEPGMTFERMKMGLDFQKVNALFARFFGSQLRQSTSKA